MRTAASFTRCVVIAATIVAGGQDAAVASIITLPDVAASISVSASTVGGFSIDGSSVPPGGFPLLVAVSVGGNSAIPNTSAFAVAGAMAV